MSFNAFNRPPPLGVRKEGWIQNLLTNTLAPVADTTTLRAPLYTRLAKAAAVTTFVAANLLPTLLAPVVVARPFVQSDWPIQPKLAVQRLADAPRNLLLTLPPGSLPFAKADWPIIQPTPRVSVSFESRNLLAPLLAPPFGQTDWPIQAKLARQREADATPNLLLRLPPGSLPFAQTDWPMLARVLGRQANNPLNLLTNTLGQVDKPFSPSWVIQPQAALLKPADAIPNLLLRLPPGSLPFSQNDWPLLQRVLSRQAVDPLNLLTTLFAPTSAPFAQLNWPISPYRLNLRPSDPQNLLQTLLAPITTAPFVQRDWALVPQFVTLRHAEPIPDTLLGLPPGKLAFSQTSWPIQPRMAVHRLADAPRNITINLPAPQVAGGTIKHKRKWRRS